MDYKFFFFPWFDEDLYTLDDNNIIINEETRKYFDSLRNNEYIIRKYP
tara:strand:+ start:1846 stop:1989 length:144 start_codon:yes stop_codon:yes gene_type:complete